MIQDLFSGLFNKECNERIVKKLAIKERFNAQESNRNFVIPEQILSSDSNKIYIKSPLNYIGGKHKIIDQVFDKFPERIGSFVDLFAGGMNIAINAKSHAIHVNDNLSYLIDMYKLFQELSLSNVINHLEAQIAKFELTKFNEVGYVNFRKYYNEKKYPLDLFVLIAFSFNHQIRFNNSHEYNNPFGKNRSSYNDKMKSNLIRFIHKIQSSNFIFSSLSFEDFEFSSFDKNSFVYCDPPYLISTGSYNDGKRGFKGWGIEQEILLLDKLDEINSLGIKFALSNVLEHKGRSNSLLKSWINDNGYFVSHIDSDYSNSNYQSSKNHNKESVEVLITNYDADRKKIINLCK
jgi:DNA adenine methylase